MNMHQIHKTVKQAYEELVKDSNSPLLQELWDCVHPNEKGHPDITNNEYISWQNSLPILFERIINAGLDNLDIFMEYNTDIGGRVDALLVGFNTDNKPCIVLFELKQWENIISDPTASRGVVYIPEDPRTKRAHPLAQLERYQETFSQNTATKDEDIEFYKIAFLHNFPNPNKLVEKPYEHWKDQQNEIYGKNDYKKLESFLKNTLIPKENTELTNQLAKAYYELKPVSIEALRDVLKGKEFAVMVEDQEDVRKEVIPKIREHIKQLPKDSKNKSKQMIVIHGGPGTGKTIIGLQLLCDYEEIVQPLRVKYKDNYYISRILNRNDTNIFCVPRCETIHEAILKKTGIKIKYPRYLSQPTNMLIVDEAHRIDNVEEELDIYYKNTDFVILLQDDRQRIYPDDSGTLDNFKNYAQEHNIEFSTHELKSQKRSGYLGNYVDSIDKLLYSSGSEPIVQKNFNIDIYSNPKTMLKDLKEDAETNSNNRNKLIAPIDWSWNGESGYVAIPDETNGQIFRKPWNPSKGEQGDWYWAEGPDSVTSGQIDKIGCVYTVQGLEFDNVGFIWGRDFTWDKNNNKWKFNINMFQDNTRHIKDKLKKCTEEQKLDIMKNIYRILLTRATKSLKICFLNEPTQEHVMQVFGIEKEY